MTAIAVRSDLALGTHKISLGAGTSGDHAINLTQLETIPWTAETVNADYDAHPLGWTSSTPGQSHDPGISGSGGYLTQTFTNEDDSLRVQVAYSAPNNEIAIRYRLGGSWSSWIIHTAGTTFGKSILNAADAAAVRTLLSVSTTAAMTSAIAAGVGLVDGLQWWQTFTLHAVGVGQQDLPIIVPYNCYLTKVRYRAQDMGTGGTPLTELRLNGTAGGNTVSGTSFAPSTSPSWNTMSGSGISLSADDQLWAYSTAINTTTVGSQLKAELIVVRR